MTPASQLLLQPRQAPGPPPQGSLDRLFLVAALPAPCLPTVLLTHTCSQLPWGGGLREERLSFTLTQLLREGFLNQAWVLRPASLFSSGGEDRGARGGLVRPGAFPLPWNSSMGTT